MAISTPLFRDSKFDRLRPIFADFVGRELPVRNLVSLLTSIAGFVNHSDLCEVIGAISLHMPVRLARAAVATRDHGPLVLAGF